MSPRQGKVWGSRRAGSREPEGLPNGEEPVLLRTPARPPLLVLPLPPRVGTPAQPGKPGNGCAERGKGGVCSLAPRLGADSLWGWGVGKTPQFEECVQINYISAEKARALVPSLRQTGRDRGGFASPPLA